MTANARYALAVLYLSIGGSMEKSSAKNYLIIFFMILITSLMVNAIFLMFDSKILLNHKNNYKTMFNDLRLDLQGVKVQLIDLIKDQESSEDFEKVKTYLDSNELILLEIKQLSEQIKKYHPMENISLEQNITDIRLNETNSIKTHDNMDPMILAEQQHDALPVDEGWAADAIVSIRQSISLGEIEGAYLNSVDCRTKSCKLGLNFNSSSQIEPAIEKIISKINWDHQHTLKMSERGLKIIFSGKNE
ncbi:hypothetical protein [Spartinivicinus ruber]|uniref:hypothetical protein n=1 Tax=Spartinivicinus ruber TaxID=2683272 RepID=UPI0013D52340|nr:hypothetical protein [Spartinivicinus ruber]